MTCLPHLSTKRLLKREEGSGRSGALHVKLRHYIVCLVLIVLSFSFPAAHGNVPDEISACYHPLIGGLIERLRQEGFDLDYLSSLFMDPRAELAPELMTITLGSRETTSLYAQFLSPDAIRLAKTFLRQHLKTLAPIEKRFNVDKEVIVAILLVESRFGENTGKRRVLSTLTSMAVMDAPENLQTQYLFIQGIDPDFSYEVLEGLAKRRAQWAYRELKCFLKILQNETIDPLEVKGSYAGALGMPQFLPSSYLTYSMNSKNFEEWLSSKEAAMVSIANYLKSNGWKKTLSVQRKRQVLWSYNHSEPYIDTILQIARHIQPQPRSPRAKASPK